MADHDHVLGTGGQSRGVLLVQAGQVLDEVGRVGGVGLRVVRVDRAECVGDLVGHTGQSGRVEPEVWVGAGVAVAVVVGVGVAVAIVMAVIVGVAGVFGLGGAVIMILGVCVVGFGFGVVVADIRGIVVVVVVVVVLGLAVGVIVLVVVLTLVVGTLVVGTLVVGTLVVLRGRGGVHHVRAVDLGQGIVQGRLEAGQAQDQVGALQGEHVPGGQLQVVRLRAGGGEGLHVHLGSTDPFGHELQRVERSDHADGSCAGVAGGAAAQQQCSGRGSSERPRTAPTTSHGNDSHSSEVGVSK